MDSTSAGQINDLKKAASLFSISKRDADSWIEVPVLCPESIIKSGQDAGISVIAGLYCLELRATIEGKAEKDRLEYLRKQLEKLSSAVEEVTETACHACAYTKKIDPWLSC